MGTLPDDPAELRATLEGACRAFDLAIASAREQHRARRRAVLAEFAGLLADQAATLRELGDGAHAQAAESLAAQVSLELALPGAPEAMPEAILPPEPPLASAPAETSVPSAEEEPAPRATEDEKRELAAITSEARELDLMAWGQQSDLDEVEARIALLALRARAFQDVHPLVRNEATTGGRALHETFGILTRLAKEYLVPKGRFVPYLRRDHRANWRSETERWRRQLGDVARKQAEAAARADSERRRLAVMTEQARVRELIFSELSDVLSRADSDPFWEFDFLDAVREALTCAEPHDEQLLSIVAPHARLFATGGEFRPLRRQLKKREGPVPASAEVRHDEQPAPSPAASHPFKHYCGAFAGQRAAIVGASCREHRRIALRDFFGFEELEWHENGRTEGGDGAVIAQRIENGSYDLVFLLADFSSHSLQDHVKDACKGSGVPFVLVRHGYGIVAFGRALSDAGRLVQLAG